MTDLTTEQQRDIAVEVLREARTDLSLTRSNIMVEMTMSEGAAYRWEDVPEKIKERLNKIDAALKACEAPAGDEGRKLEITPTDHLINGCIHGFLIGQTNDYDKLNAILAEKGQCFQLSPVDPERTTKGTAEQAIEWAVKHCAYEQGVRFLCLWLEGAPDALARRFPQYLEWLAGR